MILDDIRRRNIWKYFFKTVFPIKQSFLKISFLKTLKMFFITKTIFFIIQSEKKYNND
jgi:hypothetical protein